MHPLEAEACDAVGRDHYEHGAQPGQGYRNGYRTGRLKTAEGAMAYSAPQIAGRDEPYCSAIREHLKGHTQGLEDLAIEMMARGLSVPPTGRPLPSLLPFLNGISYVYPMLKLPTAAQRT